MMNPELRIAVQAFLKGRGISPDRATLQRLPGDGSRRIFWRIRAQEEGPSFIAMMNPPDTPLMERENRAYLEIGRHLYGKGLPVPRIHQYHLGSGWFIMEDLGATTLQDAALLEPDPLPLYEEAAALLFRLQTEGALGFDTGWCWQTARYDHTVMLQYEAHYFRDAFLVRYLGLPEGGPNLDPAFCRLAERALPPKADFFLHRDFQSRNLMIRNGRFGIVDWQGGRLGPLGYDLASLIIDPYTRLSPIQREAVYRFYLQRVREHHPEWTGLLENSYPYLAIQRNLQILGAFSHLSQAMGKTRFEAYIPDALKTLHHLLHQVPDPQLSPLRDLVDDLASGHPRRKKDL